MSTQEKLVELAEESVGIIKEVINRVEEESQIANVNYNKCGDTIIFTLKNDKTIDRRQVSDVVFSHPELLEKLNQIIHPAVKQYIREQLAVKKQQGQKICVVEAALLLEDHYQEFCDTIWYIHTDEEIRIRRLMENRGYTREKSVSIIASQAPETFFRENADYVVVNNGDFAQTRRQIEEGIRKYETL